MSEADVVVIGAGLSGLVAALTAAGRGRRTAVVASGVGAIAIASGTIDVLGATADGQPVRDLEDGLVRLPSEHPYRRLGAQAVRQGLEAFQERCRREGYPYLGTPDRNRLVVTAAGALKPSALVPSTMDAGDLFADVPVVVVGIPALKDSYPLLVHGALAPAGTAGTGWSVAEVDVPREPGARRDLSALDVARILDTPQGRLEFARRLRDVARPGSTVLLPPVLGTAPSYDVAQELSDAVGCRLVEVAGMPPDASGYRLWQLLRGAVRRAGVELIENATVTGAEWEGRRCRAVLVGHPGAERALPADRFVLATGGFLGGGLVSGPDAVREPIFGLPLEGAAPGEQWGSPDLFDPAGHPFARAGVRVDGALRPVEADGAVAAENVLVAGRSLGGFDASVEKSGNGVAVVTGYWAGMWA